jgi:hypothetical protein
MEETIAALQRALLHHNWMRWQNVSGIYDSGTAEGVAAYIRWRTDRLTRGTLRDLQRFLVEEKYVDPGFVASEDHIEIPTAAVERMIAKMDTWTPPPPPRNWRQGKGYSDREWREIERRGSGFPG